MLVLLHRPREIGFDAFQADRSPEGHYRMAALGGPWTHASGGHYHDGRLKSLDDFVAQYDQYFALGLSAAAKRDLVAYLQSL